MHTADAPKTVDILISLASMQNGGVPCEVFMAYSVPCSFLLLLFPSPLPSSTLAGPLPLNSLSSAFLPYVSVYIANPVSCAYGSLNEQCRPQAQVCEHFVPC